MIDPCLRIYLRDHEAAAQAGTRLARRVARLDPELAGIGDEIEEDLQSLRSAMLRLEVSPSPIKDALAIVGERLGRLVPNGRLIRRSPLSDLLELETLGVGIAGKAALWASLREAQVLPLDLLDRLGTRAEDQRRRVEAVRLRTARRILA